MYNRIRNNYKTRIAKIVAELCGYDIKRIKSETSFSYDLGMDSLEITELFLRVEKEFNVFIPDAESEKLKTVDDVVKYIIGSKQKTNVLSKIQNVKHLRLKRFIKNRIR